jgi:histidyl-tRNA synthetase
MRDFLPDDVRRRAHVIDTIARVYERYGFEPLETPAVENLETLLGKYGEEGDKLVFKILKRGEHEGSGQADLALRYDLTVPLARVVAEHRGKLPKFFKRYQIQPVWRADRPQRGRFREFYQCDVDAIGSTSPVIEAELCAASADALISLGFADFVIRLNDRRVLAGMLDAAGVPAERHGDALVALDKLDKVGRDGVAAELDGRGVGDAGRRVLDLFTEIGALATACGTDIERFNAQVGTRLRTFVGTHEAGGEGLTRLADVLALSGGSPAANRLRVDPALARGLSYYTGAIMEISVPDLAGSLGGGGRYDNLVGMFLGQDVPACGFSLGLERIIVVMSERGMFPESLQARPADVMVTIWNEATNAASLELAARLRSAGLRVDVYPDADKLGKQFKYASARNVPLVTVLGDDERASGHVAVKDMRTGEQAAIGRGDVAGYIKGKL